ncbi:DUF1707 SHOCT-like domain-containing protein [Streptomyces kanamyceticus]|uniref:DUF1707 domain-containing protein n=1 Tax=Streptomyces kanamyceticus TaxID=1967 RepID=A0A5J6GQN2_STRKN|nr:DUF1707 domain-containing protein [Streptomyces kanamyceticus]QEU96684.1 DUF1707 domain-containing protein [Streptomyces kanamyceticus]
MTSLPEDLPTAIGDEDRDAAVRRLQEAYADGYLSHEEMDGHLGQVLAATRRSELDAALSSLPAEKPGTIATIGAAGGRIKRSGAWQVPRTLKVASAYGRVRLDLSRAVIEHPVIDIELAVGTGRAKITVPHDAVVVLDELNTGWKDYRYQPPRRSSGPRGPEIRISGTMGFGRLTVRHARR